MHPEIVIYTDTWYDSGPFMVRHCELCQASESWVLSAAGIRRRITQPLRHAGGCPVPNLPESEEQLNAQRAGQQP